MDNVTHSLIGVTIAGALQARKPGADPRPLVWTAVLASNLPDLDFIVRFLPGADGLGYLLHHRGFTHTVLLLPLFGALSALPGAWLGAGARGLNNLASGDWLWLFGAGLLGTFFHVFADFWNSYGVHPFSPFLNRWYYGDFIFILEPFLWASLLPFAFFHARHRLAQGLCALLGAGLLAAAWWMRSVPWEVALALSIYFALFTALQARTTGVRVPISGAVGVLLAFAVGSHLIKSRVGAQLASYAPAERVTDLASSPAPGNPFCWQVLALSLDREQDSYRARVGVGSLAPRVFPPERCFGNLLSGGTAPLVASVLPQESWLRWRGDFQARFSELEGLSNKYCRFGALLSFLRAPYWVRTPEGLQVGDLRYDRGRGKRSFADRLLTEDDSCASSSGPFVAWPKWDWPVMRGL
ncbi:MAG: metal-dependent hydrolase [Oligoflexia bacterium]|nr:metal-dependent hydrolase [Oligoflexia bacterium]